MLETRVTEFSLPGYHLTEIIQEGPSTILYRGYRDADRRPVMLNLLKADCLTPAAINHLKAVAAMARSLQLSGLAAPLDGADPTAQCPALVLADFGGQSLQLLLTQRRLTLVESLTVLLQVVETLGKLHEHRMIHQQIRPSSLLINPATLAVCLIDPGLLSWLPPEMSGMVSGIALASSEEAIAYLAPEQTGRMNRPVDYRADFYALGVMFYQFLTGQLPFSSPDVNELIHAHIAKQPPPPHQLVASLPAGLSAIALKLLAKSADDRYQSAYGLQQDLQHCLHQLQATSRVPDFPLGRHDMSSQFRLPQKLYGRQRELTVLLNAFAQASDGQTTALWLNGAAGVGKSLLVYELQKAVLQRGGYFISGKFDPLRQDVPYACLGQAFQELIRQVLTESSARIALWRDQLDQALGGNAAVLLEVLPELELLLGPLPEVPVLGPVEAQYRFHRVFCQFVQVFAQRAHPLVLFLDQLQWADRALVQLVQRLLSDLDRGALLLIGTYREVVPQSPFDQLLAAPPPSGGPGAAVRHLTLPTLDLLWMVQLVADALHCDLARAQPLAELVFHRTQGNPLFAHQLLECLYADRLLVFNFEAGQWQWQMEAIRNRGITADVLTLMGAKIQQLAPATQHILKLAACIGERFDLAMLTALSDLPRPIVTQHLSEALRYGLILPIVNSSGRRRSLGPVERPPLEPSFRFLHDRVRQAAYGMIELADRADRHWQIGQVSLRQMLNHRQSESLFDVVNQLNLGQALIQTLTERQELAHLNWRAGQKAKAAAAYEPALKYFTTALALLPEDSWHSDGATTLALWMEQAECQSLCGQFAAAGQSFTTVRAYATTPTEQATAYTRQMACYIHQNRDSEAIQLGLAGLALLGLSLPEQPSPDQVAVALAQVRIWAMTRRQRFGGWPIAHPPPTPKSAANCACSRPWPPPPLAAIARCTT
jgi:serine/threonine protein kinase